MTMASFALSGIDVVILSLIVVVMALIIRGMLKGTVKGCDGDCGSCGSACAAPRIKISEEDLARIEALRAESERDA